MGFLQNISFLIPSSFVYPSCIVASDRYDVPVSLIAVNLDLMANC